MYMVGRLLVGADADVIQVMRPLFPAGLIPSYRACFGLVARGRIAGGVLFYGLRPELEIEVCVGIDDPRAVTRGVIRELADIVFKDAKVRRVTAETERRNKRARRALERLGFRLEGVKRRAAPDGGAVMIYGLLREELKL